MLDSATLKFVKYNDSFEVLQINGRLCIRKFASQTEILMQFNSNNYLLIVKEHKKGAITYKPGQYVQVHRSIYQGLIDSGVAVAATREEKYAAVAAAQKAAGQPPVPDDIDNVSKD